MGELNNYILCTELRLQISASMMDLLSGPLLGHGVPYYKTSIIMVRHGCFSQVVGVCPRTVLYL